MIHSLHKLTLLVIVILWSQVAKADEPNAIQVLQKAEQKLLSSSMITTMNITIERPRWTKQMELKTWSKGKDYAAAYVIGPEKDKGTVYLKSKNAVYNYLPKIKKSIQLPVTMLNQSWMGTDLSADDLIKLTNITQDYNARITGSQNVSGRLCYEILLTPKEDADVLWGKLIIYIDKVDYIQLKTVFYDEDLVAVNTLVASQIKVFGDRKLASKIVMTPQKKTGYKTTIEYTRIIFNQSIPSSFFTKENLPKIKP
jgi:outer membrane lipoprotein-sorting protein